MDIDEGSGFADRLCAALQVRPGEGARTALLFTHLLLASSIFILGRTVRDTLFLSRYPLSALPWMFVLYGVASAITVVVYSLVADRMRRERMIVLSVTVGAITYLGTWLAIRAGLAWIYPAFYVWSEVAANLFIVQFWTLANDLHDARAARRLVPLIGSARVGGVVVIGLLSGAIVRLIGTEQLLFVLVGMMALIALLARRLGREARSAQVEPGARRRRPPRIAGDPYVRSLAFFLLVGFTALTIGDYQFKAVAKATYSEEALATFFSLFYAGTGIISFVFQVVVTPRLLKRFGVGCGMAVMPAVFGMASLALLMVPQLAVATVLKFSDNGFQYTVHETTLQALYAPFASGVKARTRAFLDAVVKPLSYGLGGLVLLLLATRLSVQLLSIVTVALVAVWLTLVPLVRRRYLRTLEATLSARGRLALEGRPVLDSEGRAALLRHLAIGRPGASIAALEQIGRDAPQEVRRAVERLAVEAIPSVRAAALRRLPLLRDASSDPARAALGDPDPEVRAAAAAAFARLRGDEALDALEPLLADGKSAVRVAALAGLLSRGGVEGGLRGAARLGALLGSEQPRDRVEAAKVLRRLGPGAYRPIRDLLKDDSAKVRRAALKSARSVADPRLVPLLIEALHGSSTRVRACAALEAVGEPAFVPLLALLDDPSTPRRVRLELPRLLRAIPSRAGYERLERLADVPDGHLRLRVLGGLSKLRSTLGLGPAPLARVGALLEGELREAYERMAAWGRVKERYDEPVLAEEMRLRARRSIKRMLRILELRYDRPTLRLVRRSLVQRARRANAIEVLDTILEPELRPLLLPILDDVDEGKKLQRAGTLLAAVPEPEAYLLAQCEHPNPFVAVVALHALARRPAPRVIAGARAALGHREPMVREEAADLLFRCAPDEAPACIAALVDDRDPIVAGRARQLLAALAHDPPEDVPMHTTLEKILLLKSASVFAEVPSEDLAPLAHVARELSVERGEEICTQGEVGDELYVIVSGEVAVTRDGHPLATLGPGDAFGEMAVLDAEPRSATVTATGQVALLAIGSEEFYEILHEQVEIAEGVIRMLLDRLRG